MDCTLRELTSLIKEVNPDARRRGTTFDFAIVAPDRMNNRYTIRDIGNTMNGQRGVDDGKSVKYLSYLFFFLSDCSLSMCKFEIGDFIDVAITMPGVGPGPVRRYGSFGMRRNGDDFDRDRRRFSPVRERY
ncbi:unnamed protein product [Cylicostephanus goldi]|uniref:18 kDa Sin3-associated polypeptide n=1 Tax=Cylicostephanus goldi TaxID=71465 RepID=A0A3P6R807_CYLGO|nr:unnamed protein product [Cylicostephanus goldi]